MEEGLERDIVPLTPRAASTPTGVLLGTEALPSGPQPNEDTDAQGSDMSYSGYSPHTPTPSMRAWLASGPNGLNGPLSVESETEQVDSDTSENEDEILDSDEERGESIQRAKDELEGFAHVYGYVLNTTTDKVHRVRDNPGDLDVVLPQGGFATFCGEIPYQWIGHSGGAPSHTFIDNVSGLIGHKLCTKRCFHGISERTWSICADG